LEILEELGRASRTHSEKRDAVSASLPSFRTAGAVFALLSGLSMLAYSRSVQLPFIADDYAQIQLARDDGPASGWGALAADALYRCRATSLVLTYWTTLWLNRYPVRGTASFRQPSFFRRIVQNLPYLFSTRGALQSGSVVGTNALCGQDLFALVDPYVGSLFLFLYGH